MLVTIHVLIDIDDGFRLCCASSPLCAVAESRVLAIEDDEMAEVSAHCCMLR